MSRHIRIRSSTWIGAFLSSAAGLFAVGLSRGFMGPIARQVGVEFRLTHTEIAWFLSSVSVASFAATLPVGVIGPTIGARVLPWISSGLLLTSMFLLGSAHGLPALLVGGSLLGIFQRNTAIGINIVLGQGSWQRKVRLLQSTHAIATLGTLAGPLIVSTAVLSGGSWRYACVALAGFTVIYAWMSLYSSSEPATAAGLRVLRGQWTRLSAHRSRVSLISIVAFFSVGLELGLTNWLPIFFGKNDLMLAFLVLIFLGRTIGVVVIPALGEARTLVLSTVATGCIVFFAYIGELYGIAWLQALAVLSGLSLSVMFPICVSLATSHGKKGDLTPKDAGSELVVPLLAMATTLGLTTFNLFTGSVMDRLAHVPTLLVALTFAIGAIFFGALFYLRFDRLRGMRSATFDRSATSRIEPT